MRHFPASGRIIRTTSGPVLLDMTQGAPIWGIWEGGSGSPPGRVGGARSGRSARPPRKPERNWQNWTPSRISPGRPFRSLRRWWRRESLDASWFLKFQDQVLWEINNHISMTGGRSGSGTMRRNSSVTWHSWIFTGTKRGAGRFSRSSGSAWFLHSRNCGSRRVDAVLLWLRRGECRGSGAGGGGTRGIEG